MADIFKRFKIADFYIIDFRKRLSADILPDMAELECVVLAWRAQAEDGKKLSWLPDELYVIVLEDGVTADKGDIFGLCLSDD